MRFNLTTIQHHKHGDTKEVVSFAWLPTAVGKQKLWLESYVTLWVYIIEQVNTNIEGVSGTLSIGTWKRVNSKPVKDK